MLFFLMIHTVHLYDTINIAYRDDECRPRLPHGLDWSGHASGASCLCGVASLATTTVPYQIMDHESCMAHGPSIPSQSLNS